MREKQKKIYYFIISQSLNIFSNRCLSNNKYESILYLKNPKLLSDISEVASGGIEIPNIVESTSYHVKSEKKNKVTFKTVEVLDNKKNKVKHKKKARTKIHIDKHFSSAGEDIEFNELKAVPFVKTVKNLKLKKNNKIKINLKSSTNIDQGNLSIVSENSNVREIYINDLLTVKELSIKLNVHSTEIIKWLFLQGISVTINQLLDVSISTLIAKHYNFTILKKDDLPNVVIQNKQSTAQGRSRAPVIILLGHVDHGKTTLLHAIKSDNKLILEAGNITQAIGSYEVFLDNANGVNKLIFIDTPGHEAFVTMRKRGAEITDIIILVVAADDGLKPQTIEAIKHIQSRQLPFIVAINKIDKPEASVNNVKQQLSKYSIYDQDFDSGHCIIGVSALTGQNIDLLLSSLIKLSKTQQLKSDPLQLAEGTILEAHLDKQRGPVAQLLVQNGTLKLGDVIVAANFYGKVKAIHNSLDNKVLSLESTSLANVLCFASVPPIGILFKVVPDEKMAKALVSNYTGDNHISSLLNTRIALDDVYKKGNKSILKQVNIIIKTDVQGSIDAVIHTLSSIPQEKVQINLLLVASGEISLKDIQLASTSNSIILAFNLNVSSNILSQAQKEGLILEKFKVIYDLLDYVKSHMLTLVDIEYEKQILGNAVVKNIFTINKGVVAGCFITHGKLKKNVYFNVTRKNEIQYIGIIDSLKRLKEDAEEVFVNNECGVMCKDYHLWQIEDNLEAYELKPLDKIL